MLFISKSFASISNVIELGISTSDFDNPKLSCNPGNAIPTAIAFFPLSTTFPFVTVIFSLLSLFINNPATTINGVYIFSVFPFIFTL